MKIRFTLTIMAIAFVAMQQGRAKATTDAFRIHIDFPQIDKTGRLFLNVFYYSDSLFKGSLSIAFYKYANGDSILVLNNEGYKSVFKKGDNKIKLHINKADTNSTYNDRFYEILRRTDNIAPGSYKIYFTVKNGQHSIRSVYLYEVDSLLPPDSPLRQDINKVMQPNRKSVLGLRFKKLAEKELKGPEAATALAHAKRKIDKAASKKGLTTEHRNEHGKSYVDFYYLDWFSGRFEVHSKESITKQLTHQNQLATTTNFNSVTTNDLGHPSLFSQYKKLNNGKRSNDEIQGEIGLTTNVSTGQEQYAGVDNNYYELRGRIGIPVAGIPFELEGMYTSQDNHRAIKSSYFRVHYDVAKMKEDLSKSIASYNSKFAETKSKNLGMQQVYATSLHNLETQRAKLQGEINSAPKPAPNLQQKLSADLTSEARDTTGIAIVAEKPDSGDSTERHKSLTANTGKERVADSKAELTAREQQLDEKRKQIELLNKKIEKVKTLLTQNENTNHFDSVLGYNKTKDVTSQSDMTYKQLARRGTNMLPDGRAKGFITGVTNIDAGMFPKSESKYTMAGQMMKGLDLGYDFGFCEADVTLGKTEYIGRDGNLDRYTCYSERTSFRPAANQKISLIYYGYTADQAFYAGDAFFKNTAISAPGFFQPVHILSANYTGSVTDYLTITTEAATSIKSTDNTNNPKPSMAEKMAYDLAIAGSIPTTAISYDASYDKTGRQFENNTLPVTLSGTEKYTVALKDDFFRGVLSVGIAYNYLLQNNFTSRSANTKWGFDIRTNFRRYPNVSLAYKPFTTFRSYTDTLSIPQRPLLGSVWTGKASWQIKRHQRTLRFIALFSKSATTMDTTRSGNNLAQLSTIYTDKLLTSTLTVGTSEITGGVPASSMMAVPVSMLFISLNANYTLSKRLSIHGGQDLGHAEFGLCKYGMNGGCMYRPEKAPVTFRVSLRYMEYKPLSGAVWKQMLACSLDMVYRFKMTNDKKNF